MSAPTEKILVVGPSWVGDMVMSQVLYQFLHNASAAVSIDVLAPAWSAPLLARMPQVRRAITLPLGHGELGLARRRQLGHTLRDEHYDGAIVLPNSLKSSLVPYFARIPRRTGWRGEWRYGLLNDLRVLDPRALPLMAQRFLALGLPPGEELPARLPQPSLVADQREALACAYSFGLATDTPILALCPGAEFGGAKRWPAAYYAQLATHYLARGWQVVLFGGANDQQVCARIQRESGDATRCHNLAGGTTLAQVIDLMSLATAAVSNDSGLMHIAAALQRPLLAIYGATSADFTPPLSHSAVVVQSTLDCAPCFARECPLQHHRCMRDTTPASVAQQLDTLLAGAGGGG